MANKLSPLPFTWNGEGFDVKPRFQKLADQRYVVGEDYLMEAIEVRSMRSHNHYFACVHEAWLNLPERLSDQFHSETQLRKYALIKTGFAKKAQYVANSKADALAVADLVGQLVTPEDAYAIIVTTGTIVTVFTAESQSMKAPPNGMGPKRFQESKVAVLDYLADLVGITTEELNRVAKEKTEAAKQERKGNG